MQLILHIGAHRTGSTLIEKMLSACEDPGLAVWSPRVMRRMEGFAKAPRLFGRDGALRDGDARKALRALQEALAERFAELEASGIQTLVISEENILGTMPRNFRDGALYANAAHRLRAYAQVFGDAVSRIGMGIRDYGDIWNSAYGYSGARNARLPPEEDARCAMLDARRGWPCVAQDVAMAWPKAELLLWRQEDLDAQAPGIVAALADLRDPPAKMTRRVNANLERGRVIELFSPNERAELSARYARDLAQMTEMPRVRWAHRPACLAHPA